MGEKHLQAGVPGGTGPPLSIHRPRPIALHVNKISFPIVFFFISKKKCKFSDGYA